MSKTVKELIRDRYEKLLERIRHVENSTSSMEFDLAELLTTSEEHREMLARILEILEGRAQPNGGNNFFWPANRVKLGHELESGFALTSPEADDLVYKQQTPDMRAACNAFQDYLVEKYDDVELVNLQMARHAYAAGDRSKHADALVILTNPANPSEDIVVDFCFGSSEPGTLFGKLTFNWHEGPYPWWVDNNFPQQEEDG